MDTPSENVSFSYSDETQFSSFTEPQICCQNYCEYVESDTFYEEETESTFSGYETFSCTFGFDASDFTGKFSTLTGTGSVLQCQVHVILSFFVMLILVWV